jgi:septal ring factor EnvC (AmiA/AmiB activator)
MTAGLPCRAIDIDRLHLLFYQMEFRETLFDDQTFGARSVPGSTCRRTAIIKKEGLPMDRLKNLEEKINAAVEKVKALKEEKVLLERKIRDLETILDEKTHEIEGLKSEKTSIGSQIQELLNELDTIEV